MVYRNLSQWTTAERVAFGAAEIIDGLVRCYVASKLGDEIDVPEELT